MQLDQSALEACKHSYLQHWNSNKNDIIWRFLLCLIHIVSIGFNVYTYEDAKEQIKKELEYC